MKIKAIASIFKHNKQLDIFTTQEGEQWLSNTGAMYSLRGMPTMTPEMILQIFDIPTEKRNQWNCRECEMPSNIEYEYNVEEETDIELMRISINYENVNYLLFEYKQNLYRIRTEYVKPLMDEPEYLSYYARELSDGILAIACKVGLEIKAIILPITSNAEKRYEEEIKHIARLCMATETREKSKNTYEFSNPLPNVDLETGEVIEGEDSLGLIKLFDADKSDD